MCVSAYSLVRVCVSKFSFFGSSPIFVYNSAFMVNATHHQLRSVSKVFVDLSDVLRSSFSLDRNLKPQSQIVEDVQLPQEAYAFLERVSASIRYNIYQ